MDMSFLPFLTTLSLSLCLSLLVLLFVNNTAINTCCIHQTRIMKENSLNAKAANSKQKKRAIGDRREEINEGSAAAQKKGS